MSAKPLFTSNEAKIFAHSKLGGRRKKISQEDINNKYDKLEQRIVTETNREKLPLFVRGFTEDKNIVLRPNYQRRPRWTVTQKSKLIESFIMNLPVPPVFIYENSPNKYEIVDGQQRITAILEFYGNQFKLRGLKNWPELNGFSYKRLPQKIRNGIDRRSISSIVLMAESAANELEQFLLKKEVFERLNTGGVKLSSQEIRNCLAQSGFNDLLKKLSRSPEFADAWGIPRAAPNEDSHPPKALKNNKMYTTMQDVELVLRFFSLRHSDYIESGLKRFLDQYMHGATHFTKEDLDELEAIFVETLELARTIYGDTLFRPWRPDLKSWHKRRFKEYYDAVMVGLSRHRADARKLVERKLVILEQTKKLLTEDEEGIFTGKGKTKQQIRKRIADYDAMLSEVLSK